MISFVRLQSPQADVTHRLDYLALRTFSHKKNVLALMVQVLKTWLHLSLERKHHS